MKDTQIVFLENIGRQASDLLHQTQAYLGEAAPHHLNSLDAVHSQIVSTHILNHTTRLTAILAFVMAYKSYHLGHVSGVKPSWHPEQQDLKDINHAIPSELSDLATQSKRLYERLTYLQKKPLN